ncbi:MAG: rhomboid family intramembrane serine protease [Nitrospirae bacterium]|nr:rhomboid family intramembrane serine protease [Nitrospirota bacterium]MBI5694460.1 rhomboid family intramembrane serine protease [Nitrospirota bacterium]
MLPIGSNLQLKKLPRATLAIIGVNIIFFLVESSMSGPTLEWTVRTFGYGPANWWNPVALVTSLFLHGDIYHLVFNMLFFWIFAGPIEERVGSVPFTKYYFIMGFAAGVICTVMEKIARPDSVIPGIGASGAISGVMALFLYRLYYTKMKMVISPILLPRQVDIPVVPLIAFWFLQDFLMGLVSMAVPTGVGHWAHVGGFVGGIVIGKLKGFGEEGRAELLKERIQSKLEKGGGWKAAEKELLKLYNLSPKDPEVNHELARLYMGDGQPQLAERYFLAAATLLFATDPVGGAYVVTECAEALGRPVQLKYHLKAAEAFAGAGEYEEARMALRPFVRSGGGEGPLAEKALLLFIKASRHLGYTDEAYEGVGVLLHDFPDTVHKQAARAAIMAETGKVFPPARPRPPRAVKEEAAAEKKEAEALGWIEVAQGYFADPSLWSILLFLNIAVIVLYPGLYSNKFAPVFIFVAAYLMTIVHRMGDFTEYLFYFGKSDKQAHEEFEQKKVYSEAVMAEKGGKYEKAAGLYETVLRADRKNAQARLNLARIYHRRLGDEGSARRHYGALIKTLPEGQFFRMEAEEGMRQLPAGKTAGAS